jgi:hypothetical protein
MIKIKLFEAFTFDNKVLLCNTILYRFLIEKFIKGYQLTFKLQEDGIIFLINKTHQIRSMIVKASIYVLKKIYLNEKNKTI